MAVKSRTGKAKRAAAKPKRATKTKPAKKNPAKAASAKPAKKKPAKAASAKPAAKRKAPAKGPAKARSAAPSQPESVSGELLSPIDESIASAESAAKKGALARLAGGVGSLIARMTGKKVEADQPTSPESDPMISPDRNNQTIELAAGDILPESLPPPPIPETKSKRR